MYAVIKTGGKQYRVAVGEKLKVEQIPAEVGSQITLDQVLVVGSGEAVTVGTPLVKGASVAATVVDQARADKVRIFKMRRRKHYKKSQGHRQYYTELFIAGITDGSGKSAQSDKAPVIATKPDDLTKIEGIGPKINALLVAEGISTFAKLAATPVATLSDILTKAGGRFASHNPGTWPEQAKLAAAGKWDEFKKLTDELVGGVRK
jgi:large subunit ribosomal protein L21